MSDRQSREDRDETGSERFPSRDAPWTFELSNHTGVVRVFPVDDPEIILTWRKRFQRGIADWPSWELFAEHTDDRLSISVRQGGEMDRQSHRHHFVAPPFDIDLAVPRSATVRTAALSVAAGDLEITDFHPESLVVTSGSASVQLADSQAWNAEVQGDGRLAATSPASTIAITTGSGTVILAGSRADRVQIRSASGSVRIETGAESRGSIAIHTASGAVALGASDHSRVGVSCATLTGQTRVASAFVAEGAGRWRLGNDPALSVEIRTVSGDISVQRTDRPADVTRGPDKPDRQMTILERVQRGEMSVNEALDQLQD
jgi:hypothetical protein